MTQGFALRFTADRAGLGLRAGGLRPGVSQGFALRFTADRAGFRLCAGGLRPGVTQGFALRFTADRAGFGLCAGGLRPDVPVQLGLFQALRDPIPCGLDLLLRFEEDRRPFRHGYFFIPLGDHRLNGGGGTRGVIARRKRGAVVLLLQHDLDSGIVDRKKDVANRFSMLRFPEGIGGLDIPQRNGEPPLGAFGSPFQLVLSKKHGIPVLMQEQGIRPASLRLAIGFVGDRHAGLQSYLDAVYARPVIGHLPCGVSQDLGDGRHVLKCGGDILLDHVPHVVFIFFPTSERGLHVVRVGLTDQLRDEPVHELGIGLDRREKGLQHLLPVVGRGAARDDPASLGLVQSRQRIRPNGLGGVLLVCHVKEYLLIFQLQLLIQRSRRQLGGEHRGERGIMIAQKLPQGLDVHLVIFLYDPGQRESQTGLIHGEQGIDGLAPLKDSLDPHARYILLFPVDDKKERGIVEDRLILRVDPGCGASDPDLLQRGNERLFVACRRSEKGLLPFDALLRVQGVDEQLRAQRLPLRGPADLASLWIKERGLRPGMAQRFPFRRAADRAGLGLSTGGIDPSMAQRLPFRRAADRAGLGLCAGSVFPCVPMEKSTGPQRNHQDSCEQHSHDLFHDPDPPTFLFLHDS